MELLPAPGLSIDEQLCFPLYAASNLMQRLYRPQLDGLGLTYPQYLVMLTLWESSPLSVSALGDRLYLDSGTLTPLLKRLESAGHITRTRDTADERRVLIALTPPGRALRKKAKAIPADLLCRIGLPHSTLLALRDEIKQLVDQLESAIDTPLKTGTRP